MERFYINMPVAKGKPKPNRVDILMSYFAPGKENALTREQLVEIGKKEGLVNPDTSFENQDRAMRRLISKAKVDYNIKITNDGDGEGYYIPTRKESLQLDKNNGSIKKHAISTLRNNKGNSALSEDYKHGRLEEVVD